MSDDYFEGFTDALLVLVVTFAAYYFADMLMEKFYSIENSLGQKQDQMSSISKKEAEIFRPEISPKVPTGPDEARSENS